MAAITTEFDELKDLLNTYKDQLAHVQRDYDNCYAELRKQKKLVELLVELTSRALVNDYVRLNGQITFDAPL